MNLLLTLSVPTLLSLCLPLQTLWTECQKVSHLLPLFHFSPFSWMVFVPVTSRVLLWSLVQARHQGYESLGQLRTVLPTRLSRLRVVAEPVSWREAELTRTLYVDLILSPVPHWSVDGTRYSCVRSFVHVCGRMCSSPNTVSLVWLIIRNLLR